MFSRLWSLELTSVSPVNGRWLLFGFVQVACKQSVTGGKPPGPKLLQGLAGLLPLDKQIKACTPLKRKRVMKGEREGVFAISLVKK